ncbi:hypothetical protein ACH4U7_39970 [Streptomyces sp. NPDC020845]
MSQSTHLDSEFAAPDGVTLRGHGTFPAGPADTRRSPWPMGTAR